MAKKKAFFSQETLEGRIFPFWWLGTFERLDVSGPDAARLRKLRRLGADCRQLLADARAVVEDDHALVARKLVTSARFKQLISAARAMVMPTKATKIAGEPLPFRRRRAGPLLLYRIGDLERSWLSALRRSWPAEYQKLVEAIRDEFGLSAAWDPFIRICVWFNKPDLAPSKHAVPAWAGANDLPTLPIVFRDDDLTARALLDGAEGDEVARRALLFCRRFDELRRLSRESLRPQRKTYKAERRRRAAQFFRENPDATDIECWRWYTATVTGSECDLDFEAFRRIARSVRPRRHGVGPTSAFTVSGDVYLRPKTGR